ncbi:MAG TPA: EamA family transporter [Steroidobacteraceae bacterium]|nr:EamA family transporter [Steroidobacteraceae bacterium]
MQGIFYALTAAVLFGASTPLAKLLLGSLDPVQLAALLYGGAGVGLGLTLLARRGVRRQRAAVREEALWPSRAHWPAFAGAVLLGGVAGPVLLMSGLRREPAAVASLLLNLESVFTALLAWFVFREHTGRRLVIGMACIVAGGVLLSWSPGQALVFSPGAALIAGACLCWALDNNLMRKVSDGDAALLACVKGLAGGAINFLLAAALQLRWPPAGAAVAGAFLVGFVSCGLSISLFILALRQLGAARTSAYFSVAPFVGVLLALLLGHEALTGTLCAAGVLMAAGVWLHLSERHDHLHTHEPLQHSHPHVHDSHHQHVHDFPWQGHGAHTHVHQHARMSHAHAHFPDLHHAHEHAPPVEAAPPDAAAPPVGPAPDRAADEQSG